MQIASAINRTRYDFFHWRYELAVPKKLLLSIAIACLVGILAQVRVYTPWTPVPITGQTFAVLIAGVVMGRNWGGISIAIYAMLGIAGIPWFTPQAGMPLFSAGGISHLAGPTGGYIAGMILAAIFLGYLTDKYLKTRRFLNMLGLMLFASLAIIYIPGLIWLGVWLNLVSGAPTTIASIIAMGASPFILGDIIKSVAAAVTARAITPREDFSR